MFDTSWRTTAMYTVSVAMTLSLEVVGSKVAEILITPYAMY